MKIRERLLECKVKAGLKSDYALAKALDCPRQTISEVMHGKRKPDAYLAFKISNLLKIHPLILLAEFEAETAKTEERAEFWLAFERRKKKENSDSSENLYSFFGCRTNEKAALHERGIGKI